MVSEEGSPMTNRLEQIDQAAVILAAGTGTLEERVTQATAELFRDRPALDHLPEPLGALARSIGERRNGPDPAAVAKDILELAMRVRAHYTGAAEHFLNGYTDADAVYDDYDQLSGR